MRRLFTVPLALISVALAAAPAAADCTAEVGKAFEMQSKKPFVRKDTNMLTEQGPVNMVLEFQLPDRMRQIVTPVVDPKPTEMIVIGLRAWTTDDGEWFELPPAAADQAVEFMKKSLAQNGTDMGRFECKGTEALEGKQVRAYQGEIEVSKQTADMAKQQGIDDKDVKTQNEAVRLVYVDVDTGLPARAIYGRKDKPERPIYKEVYSFPATLDIKEPVLGKK
jgi:hypothetical protein